jgi:hypothetical protein
MVEDASVNVSEVALEVRRYEEGWLQEGSYEALLVARRAAG